MTYLPIDPAKFKPTTLMAPISITCMHCRHVEMTAHLRVADDNRYYYHCPNCDRFSPLYYNKEGKAS